MKSKILIVILFLFPALINAQGRFYAETNAREVLSGSYFEVDFVLENANGSNFQAPDFKNFRLISGPSQSSQISIVNGRRTQKKGFGYTLKAEKPGNYTIGPATIKVSGKIMKTKALSIKVVKGKKKSAASRAMDEQIFVVAEISDSTAYPGQQIMLKYRLYTQKRVKGYDFTSNPDYEGFYVQEVRTNSRVERKIIDGQEYTSQVLKAFALFPQKLGKLSIEPIQISLGIVQRNDPFSFFNNTKPFPVITNENIIDVIALPEGAPKSFNGALGEFSITTKLSQRKMTTDDAVSLQLTIRGNGLSKFIEAPELDLGDKFEVYDPKVVKEDVFVTNDDIESIKTFEYLLVPTKEGRHIIKVEFSYFNTDSSDYLTLYSPAYRINVSKGKNKLQGLSAEELLEKYKLKPMMTEGKIYQNRSWFFGSLWYWILTAALLSLIPIMIAIKNYRIKQGKIDPLIIKKRRASKVALQRLSKAQQHLQKDEHAAFYKEISDALLKYTGDKFGIQNLDLSKENIINSLKEHGVEDQLCEDYYGLLKSCEIAMFGGLGKDSTQQLFEKAKGVLVDLELFIKEDN